VRIAEEADHPYTLSTGLIALGLTHLRRGDLPRATRVLERGLDLSHTWQVKALYFVAAALGVAYALAGRADEALQLIVGRPLGWGLKISQGHQASHFGQRKRHRTPSVRDFVAFRGVFSSSARLGTGCIGARAFNPWR
jgi:hypothetical protein